MVTNNNPLNITDGISFSNVFIKGIAVLVNILIGFIDNKASQKNNHSIAPVTIIKNETGEYINDFARICDKNKDADNYLVSGCKKVLNILKNRNFNHIEIAKKTREYYTEDRFIETIFT